MPTMLVFILYQKNNNNNNIIIRHDSILESIQKQTTKCTRKIHNNHVKKVLQMC